MLTKRKYSKGKKRLLFALSTFFVIFLAVFILFETKARHLVAITVDNELEIIAQDSMDEAVCQVLRETDTEYTQLVSAQTSAEGNITSLKTDSKKINILKSELSKAINLNISKEKRVTVAVPSGAFTGLVLLSEIGPDLPVTLRMNGSCTTTIESEFTSAGINQTVHHIYLLVESDVSLTCPIITYETTVISRYELCQTVIVGNTPDMVANINK